MCGGGLQVILADPWRGGRRRSRTGTDGGGRSTLFFQTPRLPPTTPRSTTTTSMTRPLLLSFQVSEQHQDEELKHGHHDAPPRQQVNIEVAGPLNCWWATQCQQRAPSDDNPFAAHLMEVMDLLQGNLEGNSRLYKDPTLLMVTMN